MITLGSFLTRLSEIGVSRKAKDRLSLGALILLAAMATTNRDAFPAEKAPLTGQELNALLANGLSVNSTDMVGGKPLGLTVCWINRRSIDLHPSVPPPDHIFPDIRSLLPLLGI